MKKALLPVLALVLVFSLSLPGARPAEANGPGWVLLEELTVPALNLPVITSTETLVNGWNYLIEASGTYSAGGPYVADAEYASNNAWATWSDTVPGYESAGPTLLELKVDGLFVAWGAYNPSHIYTLDYVGTDSTVSFQIYDLGGGSNNSGSLTAKIFWQAIDKTILDDSENPTSEAGLGDHLTIQLNVTVPDAGVTITDILPDALHYIPGTFEVDGSLETPVVDGQTITYTLGASGQHTITFEVQVTSSEAEDNTVTNTASVNGDGYSASDSAELTIHSYEGFTKEVLLCTNEPWSVVPVETDVHWLLLITVENIDGDSISSMDDPVVSDRLGGDLEVDEATTKRFISPPWSGDVTLKTTGKTKKVHLTWEEFGDLDDEGLAQLWLEISTDINTGTGNSKKPGHQEYTSTGWHDLNSGAVLKFIDSEGTGFQLSAHTPSITVYATDAPLTLHEKDSIWNIVEGGAFAELWYNESGSTFDYTFSATGLVGDTDYSLIYYPEPQTTWPWPVTVIDSGTSDSSGNLALTGWYEFNDDLVNAKIWLVLTDDIVAGSLSGWNPASYLFEHHLITYDDTDVP